MVRRSRHTLDASTRATNSRLLGLLQRLTLPRPLKRSLDALQRLDQRLGVGLSPNGPWPLAWERKNGPSTATLWMRQHPILAMLPAITVVTLFSLVVYVASGQLDLEEALFAVVQGLVAGLSVYWYSRMLPRQIRSWEVWRAKHIHDQGVVTNDSR